ncbi:MAG TPA: alkaline phosphatase D family protein [Ilumatobacteraceae bacterium]|nr:alkaline phosphatase D family protein [Ilumatobacteraceae bacterium]
MSRRPTMRELGLDRLHIFVPALMSVGLLFWFAEVLRDALRWRGARSRRHRGELCGRTIAEFTVGDADQPPEAMGLRPRSAYAVWAVVFVVVAVYIAIGAFLNYTRVGGYVSDIAWLLALALVLAVAFGFAAGISTALWLRWSNLPAWLRAAANRTRLATVASEDDDRGPSWRLTTALVVASVGAAMFSLMVGSSPHVVQQLDESVSSWVRSREVFDVLRFLDPWGSPGVSVLLAVVIGLAALRCRPGAIIFVGSIVAAIALNAALRSVIERPRPDAAEVATTSFPSGDVLQAAALAGLLPLALVAITGRRRLAPPLGALLVVVAGAGAIHRVYVGAYWPADVVGSGLLGLTIALGSWWGIEHRSWHATCRGCVWAPAGHERRRRGTLHVAPHHLPTIRQIAHLSAAGAALGLAVLTLTVGVPESADGTVFGPEVTTAVQLGLAGLVSIGALVAWRWDAVGAVLIALAAAGLGMFAAVEYAPAVTLGLTAVLFLPALLLWVGWQHERTWGEMVGLALFTTALLGGTAIGSNHVYDLYYGPTHPDSTAVELPVDMVEWVWTGGLQSDAVTIVARLAGADGPVEVVLTPDAGPAVTVDSLVPDEHGVVRASAARLQPATNYRFTVVVDGEPDATRGAGSFRTPGLGAESFRVALSACARVGSNASVFDAIAAADPLLYVQMGDIHYADIGRNSPEAFRTAYDRLLTEPGQAALYRQVPIAYVWDDHDYGPNDADATSASRPAARQVYREVVPHAGVQPGDAPINQAFTIGRVRFVMTDNRSERTADSMLGESQLAWLLDELTTTSRTHALVVWVNPVPWIAEPRDGGDNWNGYPDERRLIANAIAAADIDNLIMVSGDAHMFALDDGSNSDYSAEGDAGFPVFHAAPLDRPGSIKGGPYSDGVFDGVGQFGLLDVVDAGDTISVTTTGTNWKGEVLVQHTFTFDVPSTVR